MIRRTRSPRWRRALSWCGLLVLGCSLLPAAETDADIADEEFFDEYAVPEVSDPLEAMNRTMFRFNATVMKFVLRPVSRGYETVVPRLARRGIGNFFDNLRYPVRLTSSALQGKFDRAGAETGKFLFNTTIGVGGLFKVSDTIPGLRVPAEDVGQTFGTWGVGHGPFLVLPVLGPSSARDLVGRLGDAALSPINWNLLDDYSWEVEAGVRALDTVNTLTGAVNLYDALNEGALDPYVGFRNAYLQSRDAAVDQ